MANVYVRSAAAGTGTGADWTNAFTTLAAAFTAKAAGDVFWVSEDHAETQASAITLTSPGTMANPCFVYCVNHAGTVPPVSADLRTTASITTTGNSNLTQAGSAYFYGIAFNCGTTAVGPSLTVGNSPGSWVRFDSCSLNLLATGAAVLTFGAMTSKVDLVNTALQVAVATAAIRVSTILNWWNTPNAIAGGTLPTVLFSDAFVNGGIAFLEGVDLSALGAGKTLVGASTSTQKFYFKDCKLGASVTVSPAPSAPGRNEVYLIRSDSAAANNRAEKYHYLGTETTETTIVRSGGASDGVAQSRKIVTTANSRWSFPFLSLPLSYWNTVVGVPTTVTVEGVWSGGAVPNNDDIWLEAEYLSSAATPSGAFSIGSKADNLATGAALTSSAASWASSPGTAFKMSLTFTPQMAGPVTLTIKAAKASTTFYVDPKVSVS